MTELLKANHKLSKFAKAVIKFLGSKAPISIYLVSGGEMRKINREFRGKDKATDVLSFEFPKHFPIPKGEKRPLGEVYLNPSYIKKNKETLEYLLAHGILHLFGFNHMKKGDRIKMEKLEKTLLKKFA